MAKNPLLILVIILIIALIVLGWFTYDIYSKAKECEAGVNECLAGLDQYKAGVAQCQAGLSECLAGVEALKQVPACAPYISSE